MKRARIALSLVAVALIGLIVVQNWDYFGAPQRFKVDLYVLDEHLTPGIGNWFFFIVCFLIGFLPSYIRSLIEGYRSERLIKKLYAASAAQNEEISGLKREVELLQRGPVVDDAEPILGPDTVETA